jgi:hypothetical protein
MKIIVFLFALLSFAASTPVHACDMPQGFHEFETFGENSVYLHHYPMFGSVHSYQILLKVELLQDGKDVTREFLTLRKNKGGISFSTSPVRSTGDEAYAVLTDYAKPGVKFQARIHYEAKNQSIDAYKNVTVMVKEVIVNRLMNQPAVGEAKPAALQYFYFGDSNEAYLLHQMHWNPDFDQVVQVVPVASALDCPGSVTISGRTNSEKTRLIASQTAQAGCGNETFLIQGLKEIYKEKMTIQH